MISRRPTSLLRRLLAGFVLVMLAIWALALVQIAFQVRTDQQHQTEVTNKAWARQIMLQMRALDGRSRAMHDAAAAIEGLRLDLYRELGFETNARTVVRQDGRLVYDSAPAAAATAAGWVKWVERDAASGITVERSEKPNVDWIFTPSAANYLLTPLVYSLPFLLLPAWLIVRVGLRPLRSIAAAVERRSAADLEALPASPYRELSPLVDAINSLMNRLSERLAREQEFLADAAHELKTPLSVVQLNAHLLETGADPEQRRQAAIGLREGVARATHTVHQLLAFERARADARMPVAQLDLAALVRDRLALAAPLAMQRAIDIELHGARPLVLHVHRESMAALLDNVIGNAIKYSPRGGRVEVRLETGDGPRLTVSDQGPSIAPALRAKVFERFYRVPGQDEAGSGLGLSIAERAATRNSARIRIDSGAGGRGLAVSIDFDLGAAPPLPPFLTTEEPIRAIGT